MASISDLIEGLKILRNYVGDDEHIGGAGRDIIWGVECEVSEWDALLLNDLGWHQDSEDDAGWSFFC